MASRKPVTVTIEKCNEAAAARGGKIISSKVNTNRKLKWQCQEGHIFHLTYWRVYRFGKWCPECGSSIGEREIRKFFQTNNIKFIPQYTIPNLPYRRYDFYFEWKEKKYLVEYDGQQHFYFVKKFHHTVSKFTESKIIDRIKTYAACKAGYNIIRIDYNQLSNVTDHLIKAVTSNYQIYLSTPELYQYLYQEEITVAQLTKFIH